MGSTMQGDLNNSLAIICFVPPTDFNLVFRKSKVAWHKTDCTAICVETYMHFFLFIFWLTSSAPTALCNTYQRGTSSGSYLIFIELADAFVREAWKQQFSEPIMVTPWRTPKMSGEKLQCALDEAQRRTGNTIPCTRISGRQHQQGIWKRRQ